MEALVGAVYLDRGYDYCKKFVPGKLIEPHFNIKELIESDTNFKSRIIEWSQKEGNVITFETINIKDIRNRKVFTVEVHMDGRPIATGYGGTKKKSEQDAAQKALNALNLNKE